jgi:hypothetical protein
VCSSHVHFNIFFEQDKLITSDRDYQPLNLRRTITLTNLDNPINRIRITAALKPGEACTTSEAGTGVAVAIGINDWYSGVNAFERVVVTLQSSSPTEGRISCDGGATGQAAEAILSLDNWKSMECTVVGIDDDFVDGLQRYNVALSAAVTTADGITTVVAPIQIADSLQCFNQDNDLAKVLLQQTCTETSEIGTTCQIKSSLASRPRSTVQLVFASSNTTEGVLKEDTITIAPLDWAKQNVVTVTGVDDLLFDGIQPYNITVVSESADALYDNANLSLRFWNADNEQHGKLVSVS